MEINESNMPHLKQILDRAVEEIKNKVPKSVWPDNVIYELTPENQLTITLELGVVASSIVYGTGPQNVHIKTQPFTPPADKLYEYLGKQGLNQTMGFAFYIQRRIAGKIEGRIGGTKPHQEYYDNATEEVLNNYQQQIEEAFTADIINTIDFNYKGQSLLVAE